MSVRTAVLLLALAALTAGASLATAAIVQEGTLRVAVQSELKPKRLPRTGAAPISVTVGGQISTGDESLPPQLKTLRIELNRHGRLDDSGLPTCKYGKIQPGSSSRALAACRPALVGKGRFSADIILAGQEPYPTEGKLLVFNSVQGGKPVLYGHIYSAHPFATSFVIAFKLSERKHGAYGAVLSARLPNGMKTWGRLTGLTMTLSRRFHVRGRVHSYLSSGCPAPKGIGRVAFPLARTSFAFAGDKTFSSVRPRPAAREGERDVLQRVKAIERCG